jgi:TIR domain
MKKIGTIKGYYWHEFVFGIFIAASYCISAVVANVFVVAPNVVREPLLRGVQSKLFISYRRESSRALALLIYDRVSRPYDIFWDVARIEPTNRISKKIAEALRNSDLMIALIGRDWLGDGRKIHRKDDWVRIEVSAAISLGLPILPVLLDGATMPSKEQLPVGIQAVCDIKALEVRSNDDFESDLNAVFASVKVHLDKDRRRRLAWLYRVRWWLVENVAGGGGELTSL